MSAEILKMLVESACSEGSLTDSDRVLLEKKASDFGISKDKLNEMIATALGTNNNQSSNVPPTPPSNEGSGFITNNDANKPQNINTNNDNSGSGFITSQPIPPPPPVQNTSSATVSNASTVSGAEFAAKFTDVSELSAQGAMSTVYQGKQYGKWIIIKRIKEQFRNNQDYKNLFFKEFENAYHLDHPNITRILDKGEDELGAYYTMEYVDGRPLSKMIATENLKNNEKLITRIFTQIIDALNYVHKKQIIHRDLKPDNILVTYRGDNVKILDFGLAAADSFDDNLLKVGTPKYAAPEQMTNGSKVDQRADIYALGLILLEMVTGNLNDRTAQTVENPNFKEIILKSTQQDPQDRYSDCQEILDVLKRPITATSTPQSIGAQSVNTDVNKAEKVTETPVEEEKKKSKLPLIIGIIALLLIGGAAFFILNKNKKPKTEVENVENNNQNVEDNNNVHADSQTAENNQQNVTPAPEKTQEEIERENAINQLVKDGETAYKEKNMARAKQLLDSAAKLVPDNQNVKKQLNECNKIINNSLLHELTPKKGDNGKLGFVDQDGNVVIDYLYDYTNGVNTNDATKGDHFQHATADLLVVRKDGKWGVIDDDTKLPITDFKYGCVIWSGNTGVWLYRQNKVTVGVRDRVYFKEAEGKLIYEQNIKNF